MFQQNILVRLQRFYFTSGSFELVGTAKVLNITNYQIFYRYLLIFSNYISIECQPDLYLGSQ